MDESAAVDVAPPGDGGLGWSSAWALEPSADALVLSAGPDRRAAIDGLDAAACTAVERWQAGQPVVPEGDVQRQLVDRLVALGALVPGVARSDQLQLVGDPEVTDELARLLGPGATATPVGTTEPATTAALTAPSTPGEPPRPGDLVVAVRSGSTWPDVPGDRIHLGLDLALHHTIVLGPLVVPGASACLGCLDIHVARTWPTPAMPQRPAVQRRLAVAAALLQVQAELVAGGTSPLVNATVAWDLERGSTDRQPLYKVSGCPRCDVGQRDGRVALPWEADQ